MEESTIKEKKRVAQHTKRITAANKQNHLQETPESELISAEEYFGILHQMVDEHFDNIQC